MSEKIPYRKLSKEIRQCVTMQAVKQITPCRKKFKESLEKTVYAKTQKVLEDTERLIKNYDKGLFNKIYKYQDVWFELPVVHLHNSTMHMTFDIGKKFEDRPLIFEGGGALSRVVYQECLKSKIFKSKIDKWRAEVKACKDLQKKVHEVVYSCKTLKDLIEAWPESKKFIPDWAWPTPAKPKEAQKQMMIRQSTVTEINELLGA